MHINEKKTIYIYIVNFELLKKCDKDIIEKILSYNEHNNLDIYDDNKETKINTSSNESDDDIDIEPELNFNSNDIKKYDCLFKRSNSY